ncbi:MAG: CoA ester lyase [Alphaproteobacteria bacterium HGW-Alphaproteobacteria-10]|nr:MAG: CoA ester lyase [Alphaproteobacteria bacterium HGW-Alphaproteobacteria-10]
MRLRSLLYVPADQPRFVARAHERGADALILDLEDSVAPDAKPAARAALAQSVASAGQSGCPVFVRVNSDAALAEDATMAAQAGAFGLYLPKASAAQLARLDAAQQATGSALPVVALIEDPAALLESAAIAAHPGVVALSLGGEDLATALGAAPDSAVLHHARLMVHLAAKAAGRMSLGLFAPIANYTDLDGIARAASEAKRNGFDGASCVHPSAVPILNAAFQPSAAEITWANAVLLAAGSARGGAFQFEGRMIDLPILQRAERIRALARHE